MNICPECGYVTHDEPLALKHSVQLERIERQLKEQMQCILRLQERIESLEDICCEE